MTLKQWHETPDLATGLAGLLAHGPLAEAIAIARERATPSASDVKGLSAPDRVVAAASQHDVQSGWHDCIRFLMALAMPKSVSIETPAMQQYSEEYVRRVMKEQGRPLPEPDRKPKNKNK